MNSSSLKWEWTITGYIFFAESDVLWLNKRPGHSVVYGQPVWRDREQTGWGFWDWKPQLETLKIWSTMSFFQIQHFPIISCSKSSISDLILNKSWQHSLDQNCIALSTKNENRFTTNNRYFRFFCAPIHNGMYSNRKRFCRELSECRHFKVSGNQPFLGWRWCFPSCNLNSEERDSIFVILGITTISKGEANGNVLRFSD